MSEEAKDRERLMYGYAAALAALALLVGILASLAAPHRIGNRENGHTVLLRSSVDKWNAWREQHPKKGVDLSEVNLSRANLAGANLRNARFAGFVGSNLAYVNLAGADLNEASMNRSTLRGADLSNSTMNQTVLAMTNLEEAKLIKADVRNASFLEANLRNADLTGMLASGADFYHADLEGVNLERADFTGADLRGADFRRATGWRTATFRCADITGVQASLTLLECMRQTGGIEMLGKSDDERKVIQDACIDRMVKSRQPEEKAKED